VFNRAGVFDAMLRGSWRALRNGGLFFARLTSSIGMEERVTPLEGRRHRLPDGTERYLVDEPLLRRYGRSLGEPLSSH
jgi:tellurite methyltransferase